MQPSSLIFLVIVAIWVAYLIQHWVRRREHLATARSVDRFSEAMRVLERRSPLPATMLASAGPSSSDPRGSRTPTERPEVVVKRASVSSPLRARHGATAAGAAPSAQTGQSGHLTGPAHAVAPIELVPHRTTLQIALRRARAVFFLAALVAVPTTLVLSAVHILKWLSVTLAVVGLVVAVVWLRLAAIQEQTARRARRAELRRLERLRAGDISVTSRARSASSASSATAPGSRPAKAAAAEPLAPKATPVVAPVEPAEAVVHEVDPDAWQPVPVPPPTYTLKEPAHRPQPSPAPSPASLRPVPIEVEDDEIEVMAAFHGRRVVGH